MVILPKRSTFILTNMVNVLYVPPSIRNISHMYHQSISKNVFGHLFGKHIPTIIQLRFVFVNGTLPLFLEPLTLKIRASYLCLILPLNLSPNSNSKPICFWNGGIPTLWNMRRVGPHLLKLRCDLSQLNLQN